MDIRFSINNNTLIATLKGELDHHCSENVRESIESKLKEEGVINLILDMSNVTFMDSSGIGVIMGRYKNIRALDGKLLLSGINGHALKIYEMSGLSSIIKCYKDSTEALSRI